jgi:hypothetical protein
MPNGHGPRFDSYAMGDVRTVLMSEETYRNATNGAGFGRLECLVSPADCLTGYSGPTFLDAKLLKPERHMYAFTFHPGLVVETSAAGARNVLQRYAYVAVPWDRSVGLAICGDSEGRLCRLELKQPLEVKDARCPESCTPAY